MSLYEIIFLLTSAFFLFVIILMQKDNIVLRIKPDTRKVYFLDSQQFEIVELDKNKNFKRGGKNFLYDKKLVKGGLALYDSDKAINIPLDKDTPSSQEHTTFANERIFERLMLALHGTPIQQIFLIVLYIAFVITLDSLKIWGIIK